MADTTGIHAVRPIDAQSALSGRDYRDTTRSAADSEPAILARQRRAREQTRRAKQRVRYRHHEFAVIQRTDTAERAGPGIGDRQGEVV